jgi:hypothetical protein
MYGVASETTTVARSRSRAPGQGIGPRRIEKAPGPVAHALDADGSALCGADVAGLIAWPGLDFADVATPVRCPRCQSLAAA